MPAMAEESAETRWNRWYASLTPEVAEGVANLFTAAAGRAALAVRLVLDGDPARRTIQRELAQAVSVLRQLEQVLGAAVAEITSVRAPAFAGLDETAQELLPKTGRGVLLRLGTDEQAAMLAHLREAVQHCRIAADGVRGDERLPVIRLHIGAAAAALGNAAHLIHVQQREPPPLT